MNVFSKLAIRRRARLATLRALSFAENLRARKSEFARSHRATLEHIGDELAELARDRYRGDDERRALLAGFLAAVHALYRNYPLLAQRETQRLSSRVMAAQPKSSRARAWLDAAV